MFFRDRKKDYHGNIIDHMNCSHYDDATGGVCFGLSAMALQAILLSDTASYDKRIKKLYDISPYELPYRIENAKKYWEMIEDEIKSSLASIYDKDKYQLKYKEATEKEWLKFDSSMKCLLSIEAFMDGVSLYQSPYLYGYLFKAADRPYNQSLKASSSLVLPEPLVEQSGMSLIDSFCGVYTTSEIRNNLQSLRKSLVTNHVKFPVGMVLTSHDHAFTIGFDPKFNKWIFIEAANGPSELMSERALANKINKVFSNNSMTAFDTKIHVAGNNNQEAQHAIAQWKLSREYIDSHTITPKRANYQDSNFVTMLYIAAQNGHLDTVKALLANGARVNKFSYYCPTPLYIASYYGHTEIVKELLAKGASVNTDRFTNSSPLMVAAKKNYIEIVIALLNHGANLSEILRLKYIMKQLKESDALYQTPPARQTVS